MVFAIDISGNMEYNGANNPRIEAVKSFIDKLNLTTDQARIIRWDDNIEFTVRLSFNKAELKSQAYEVDARGGTSLDSGINEAIAMPDMNTRMDPYGLYALNRIVALTFL